MEYIELLSIIFIILGIVLGLFKKRKSLALVKVSKKMLELIDEVKDTEKSKKEKEEYVLTSLIEYTLEESITYIEEEGKENEEKDV